MTGVFIGLGSNLGDRLSNLRKAVEGLEARSVKVLRASGVYETAPVGVEEEQRYFLNAVVEVETDLSPEELLERCSEVEEELGRTRTKQWGPREIDLDILLYRAESRSSEGLTIPHPGLTERLFALAPLLEIAPDAALTDGERLDGYLEAASAQQVRRIGPL